MNLTALPVTAAFLRSARAGLNKFPALHRRYTACRRWVAGCWKLHYYAIDGWRGFRYMIWWRHLPQNSIEIIANLYFYYHKIEKGLVMPGPARPFGFDVAPRICDLLQQWEAFDPGNFHPAYLGALSTLRAYVSRLEAEKLDPDDRVSTFLKGFLAPRTPCPPDTPIEMPSMRALGTDSAERFAQLVQFRRSVREFLPQQVDRDIVERAVRLAQQSPSACNRQSVRVIAIENKKTIKELLRVQNGNRGFGHLVPELLVVTADMRNYFDATERHQPYVDGGLFAMTLLYALQSQGVASCCLNWCAPTEADREAHRILSIPTSERIITLIAVGQPKPDVLTPRSHRRAVDEVLRFVSVSGS